MDTGQIQAPEAPRPAPTWEAAGIQTSSLRRRNFADRLARVVVSLGGVAIIIGVLGIFVFIVLEILPLMGGADADALPAISLASKSRVVAGGIDENEVVGYVIDAGGRIEYLPLGEGKPPPTVDILGVAGRKITSAFHSAGSADIALGTSDGHVLTLSHRFEVSFGEAKGIASAVRSVASKVTEGALLPLDPQGRSIDALVRVHGPAGTATVGITSDGRLLYHLGIEKETMSGEKKVSEERADLTAQLPGPASAVTLDRSLEHLFVGTKTGHLVIFRLSDPAAPSKLESHLGHSQEPAPITALALLIGDRSLVAGDAKGRIRVWCDTEVPESERGREYRVIHNFPARTDSPIAFIATSERNKAFVTGNAAGDVVLRYSTSGQDLVTLHGASSPVTWVALSPRGTGLYAAYESGTVNRWSVHNPHPEVTMGTLLGRVWYEGYPAPDYAWQSTGSTDAFEPKLSLFPLLIGTFKGTLFALIIAVPLAVLGALYTAQFMHPMLRSWVKPTVEIMAALPSVVLGFIAGLWLAPVLERTVPAVLLMFAVLPASCLGAMFLYRTLPEKLRHHHGEKLELFFLIPALLVAAWICLQLNGPVEKLCFGGDFRQWVYSALGLRFDQRNALVVGLAMGFAVIPIVFTISEDALSNVPRHLASGSLALGATRWQTAVRVVAPAALPGIFSAIMIGLGRAVGETMIVLMATGNTPTFDWWNPFTGFRTLSANIAVEIPEAPHGGTLYRTLFLGALLLFGVTFIVNTAAEIVRQRMRRRYAQL